MHGYLLDNLGITVNLRTLETWPSFVRAGGRLHGSGWLGRSWMRQIYPAIRPKEYARRKMAFEQARADVRSEFLNTVLKRGEAQINALSACGMVGG